MVLGNEELPALSVVKQLLVVTYYSGPQFLADHLQSPVCILSYHAHRFGCFFLLIQSKKTNMI